MYARQYKTTVQNYVISQYPNCPDAHLSGVRCNAINVHLPQCPFPHSPQIFLCPYFSAPPMSRGSFALVSQISAKTHLPQCPNCVGADMSQSPFALVPQKCRGQFAPMPTCLGSHFSQCSKCAEVHFCSAPNVLKPICLIASEVSRLLLPQCPSSLSALNVPGPYASIHVARPICPKLKRSNSLVPPSSRCPFVPMQYLFSLVS